MNDRRDKFPQMVGKVFAYILISLIAIAILAVAFKVVLMLVQWLF